MAHTMIRNAHVEITVGTEKGYNVDGTSRTSYYPILNIPSHGISHEFAANSKEGSIFKTQGAEGLQAYLNGGHFFFSDGAMDYRLASYRGYMHTEDSMMHLTDHLGDLQVFSGNHENARQFHRNSTSKGIFGRTIDTFGMEMSSLGEGGDFNISVNAGWSPFSHAVSLKMAVERLVCTNGMVANSRFATQQVPLVSDWENSLDIVAAKLRPATTEIISNNLQAMAHTRAPISLVENLNKLVRGSEEFSGKDSIIRLLDNDSGIYNDKALNKAAAMLPSHLTQYDIYNIATELTSHHDLGEHIGLHLNHMSGDLMFNLQKYAPMNPLHVSSGTTELSSDSDPRRAFFGQ